jgi:hypothetical protein
VMSTAAALNASVRARKPATIAKLPAPFESTLSSRPYPSAPS